MTREEFKKQHKITLMILNEMIRDVNQDSFNQNNEILVKHVQELCGSIGAGIHLINSNKTIIKIFNDLAENFLLLSNELYMQNMGKR